MAITKIQDGYYYCKQSDINLFAEAEENSVYCATDSGAIYVGKKAPDGTKVLFQLQDVIHRQDGINPVLFGMNLPKFAGHHFVVKEIMQNLLFANSARNVTAADGKYIRTGNHIDNSDNSEEYTEYININADQISSVDIAIMAPAAAGLSSGDVVIAYTEDDTPVTLYTSPSRNAGKVKVDQNVNWGEHTPKAIELAITVKAGVECYLCILDHKWNISLGNANLNSIMINSTFEYAFQIKSGSMGAILKKRSIFDISKKSASEIGKIGNFADNRFAAGEAGFEDLVVEDWADAVLQIAPTNVSSEVPYTTMPYPFFTAELVD